MIRNYTVDISDVTAYPGAAQVQIPFVGRSCSVVSRHPSALVKVSLDGIVDASVIDSARVVGMSFGTPTQVVWLCREAGEVSPETVLVDVTVEDVIY
jgi:hypothetical protein